MNKILLTLNIVLLAGMGFLFYKEYTRPKKPAQSVQAMNEKGEALIKPLKIGYFEMDSVEENFTFFKEVQKEINRRQEAKVNELTRMQTKLQQKYQEFQNLVNTPGATEQHVMAAQKELQDMDAAIKSRKDKLDQDANQYFMDNQQKILNMIRDFFKDYNENEGYTYIFASEPGLMYYKDTVYNVTKDLLVGLNDAYAREKKDKD